jgi:hypothetical protein
MRVMLGCGFFMGLPKSKAQIGWGRYWVVPAVGVVWLPTALGLVGLLPAWRLLSVCLRRWPFLDFLLVY